MMKCKVCGCEFTPISERHYIARDARESGLFIGEPKLYDAFDCPCCGSQSIVGECKREASMTDIYGEDADEEEQEED